MTNRLSSRATGIDTTTRLNVMARADNACERCGVSIVNQPGSIHHRKTRGMGGNRAANHPTNCVVLCGTGTTGCHGWVGANPNDAAATGWYVRQWDDPETVPLTNIYGHTFLLNGDGRVDL